MFSERLKFALDSGEIKQIELAKHLNLTQQAVNRWCQNITRPDFETLVRIADFLNVSTDFLLGRETKSNKNEKQLNIKQVLKDTLVENGYMSKEENLSNEELKSIMDFIKNNRKYIMKNR